MASREQPENEATNYQRYDGCYQLQSWSRLFLLKGWVTPRFCLVGVLLPLDTDDTEYQRHHQTDYDYCRQHTVNKLFYSGTKIRIYSDSCAAARDFFVSSIQSTHNWSTTSCVSSSVMVPMKSIIVSRAICCSRGVAPSSTSASTALSNSSRFMGQQVMVTQILYPLTQIAM